jgi:drug/metabolite transporter (DMT)-like permease
VLPGLLFAGDLALWHWSIRFTSVANATLLANLAPLVVTVAARVLFQERITPLFLAGMVLALAGAAMVVGQSVSLTGSHFTGDLLGLATALFYGGYMLSVKHARRRHPTVQVMIWTSLSACPVLVVVAAISGESLWPRDAAGWLGLLGLALVSQVGGQGLIAYALAHLPAAFSSVSLLLQPVVAALLAAVFLGEPLALLQGLGGTVVLAGIALAGRGGQFRNGTRPANKWRADGTPIPDDRSPITDASAQRYPD